MSALTDRIAAKHDTYLTYLHGGNLRASCEGCDWTFEGDSIDAVMECSRHIANVTEAAVREHVARDIEATYLGPDFGRNPITGQDSPHAMLAEAYDEGLSNAARIARGEQ